MQQKIRTKQTAKQYKSLKKKENLIFYYYHCCGYMHYAWHWQIYTEFRMRNCKVHTGQRAVRLVAGTCVG